MKEALWHFKDKFQRKIVGKTMGMVQKHCCNVGNFPFAGNIKMSARKIWFDSLLIEFSEIFIFKSLEDPLQYQLIQL